MNRRRIVALSACAALAWLAIPIHQAAATVTAGPGGRGVTVGASSLIGTLDYADTFRSVNLGGAAGRINAPAVQPLIPAYIVESTFGNAGKIFNIGVGFSFPHGDTPGVNGLLNGATIYPGGSGAGSADGHTQTGGGGIDYAVPYGLRDVYTVQVDASQTPDRIDISSGTGAGIFGASSLSVFFRGNGLGGASLFNGAVDTPIPAINTGIANNREWHNYAVTFNRIAKTVDIFVDEVHKANVDLNTFAGGIYANFGNENVGAGGAGGDRYWTDNFQVGGTGPPSVLITDHANPGVLPGLPAGLVSFYDFNEASGPVAGKSLNFAHDRADGRKGWFVASTGRTSGLVGNGAAEFHDTAGEGVGIDGNTLSATTGITLETLFQTSYDGSDQAEFFRKEDGGNRILLSFQSDANTGGTPQLVGTEVGFPGISLGLNVGGYVEMDVALDGLGGRPTLAQLADGEIHHLVASYDAATGVKSMYIDGALIAQLDLADGVNIVSGGAATAFIGSDRGGEVFPGVLDEFAFYNRAITPAEVLAHFQNVQQGNHYFVPEPGTWILAALGALALAVVGRVRGRRKSA